MPRLYLLVWMLLFSPFNNLLAQSQKLVINGYVSDKASSETLIGANVFVKDQPGLGTVSNAYGFYALSLEPGMYTIVCSYLGYTDYEVEVDLKTNIQLSVQLQQGIQLNEVVVTGKDEAANVNENQMGTVDIAMETITQLPALFGEVDVLKAIQLLPGVQSAGEGNAGFYVRGGGPDQNLVLLDEAVVYNSGHLLGFFSVFNADAIKRTKLIKGGMPANYGGRLSSVVDIQMKEGNMHRFGLEGGIGLIASRLTIDGPIVKDKSAFLASGRRTYALDVAQPFINNTDFAGTNYHFYDLNLKVNHRFSERDRLYLSGYFGRDVLQFKNNIRDFNFKLPYGNTTATLRWNHLFSDRLFMNVSGIYNEYDFGFEGGQEEWRIDVFSGIKDWNAKVDFDYYFNNNHHFQFGTNYTYHTISPSVATATNGEANFSNHKRALDAHEFAVYILDDWKWGNRLGFNMGLRFSGYTQLGPYQSVASNRNFGSGEPVTTYLNVEPRLTGNFKLSPNQSIKAGITRSVQYLHLVSNSTSTLPTDVWVSSTERIKPQLGWQYALGYFRNFNNNVFESSIEVYYRRLWNQIDYRENYVNNIANDLEQEFVFGKGRSYGVELFLKKRLGALNGWIGYTWSKTERQFDEINNGKVFPAIYDRRHDLAIVAQYRLSERWSLGANFVLGSGNAFTPVRSLYLINQTLVTEYAARNSARIEDYHRLDLSAIWTPKKSAEKPFFSSWAFSIYNAYNRRNPFFIYYDLDTDQTAGTAEAKAIKVSLFPIIPSVTWNFKWRTTKKSDHSK